MPLALRVGWGGHLHEPAGHGLIFDEGSADHQVAMGEVSGKEGLQLQRRDRRPIEAATRLLLLWPGAFPGTEEA